MLTKKESCAVSEWKAQFLGRVPGYLLRLGPSVWGIVASGVELWKKQVPSTTSEQS